MKAILDSLQRMKDTFLGLPRPQKILASSAALLLVASLAYAVYLSNQVEYVPLFSRLSEGEAGSIVEALKKKKLPYQLSGNGTLSVPKEQLYEIRMSLASEGVPKGGGSGFEIFDQQKLGSTEFVQKINYQRALQGELARTISQIDEVMESRVHLALPEESLFLEDRKPASAAVVLKLHPGARLNQRQIQGIVHLVASAVKGLEEDRVSILSTDGQVIFKKNPSDNPFQASATQLEYKNQLEESLRQKVQSMLEQVLGASRVISRVTADLDFNQTRVEQETYDPDSAVVRSHNRRVENSEGQDVAAKGNPDAPINLESKLAEGQPKDQQKKHNRQQETVNYEINHVNRKVVHAPGAIKKISVAVLVDGAYENKPDSAGQVKPVFVGRPPEQIKSLEEIVKKAVGYDDTRGDQITVSNVPFTVDMGPLEDAAPKNRWLEMVKSNQRMIMNAILLILVFLFVVRPILKRLQKESEPTPELAPPLSQEALPGGAGAAPGGLLGAPGSQAVPVLTMRERIEAFIEQDPEKAREIIRTWLREGA